MALRHEVAVLALYALSLGASAGIVGVYTRQILTEIGYVPSFRAALLVAGGTAFLYACAQLGYMALVRLLKPTRSPTPLLMEIFSHAAAAALIVPLLNVQVPWPHPMLIKAAPLILLGGFGAAHCFFKLASFYAAIQGPPSGRLGVLGWLTASAVCGGMALALLAGWMRGIEQSQPRASDSSDFHCMGGQYALARVVPEGAIVPCAAEPYPHAVLTFRWAPISDPADNAPVVQKLYATVSLDGSTSDQTTSLAPLNPAYWTELHFPASPTGEDVRRCRVVWNQEKPPAWRTALGRFVPVRPLSASGRRVLMSGPWMHEQRDQLTPPNFVIIVIEGLGADHVSSMGYARNTTPALDRLSRAGLVFSNAYTPSPEAAAACMTLLTGVNPLRHGYLGKQRGPLSKDYAILAEALQRMHYTTAAFTEGDSQVDKDLCFGSGFERGFEVFDPSCPADDTGSAATIDKARNWIEANTDLKHFVFIRLRELADPRWCKRYAPGFAADPTGVTPSARDVYDSAVAYVDTQLGVLIKEIRSGEAGNNTCIVVTSAYGLDFSGGDASLPTVGLTEGSLRVPLWIHLPDIKKASRTGCVGIEDIAPTVLQLAETGLDYVIDGRDLVQDTRDRTPVSMFGDPLALSYRVDRWRFSWQSGRDPVTLQPVAAESAIELYDIPRATKQGGPRNEMSKYPDLVTRYRARLSEYIGNRGGVGLVR